MREQYSDLERAEIVGNYFELVRQTAEFRFRICWEGARGLFADKGFDTQAIIQVTCDQGDDVHGIFVLPDGTMVSCDFREDPHSRQAVSFTSWELLECHRGVGTDFGLALEIVSEPGLAESFDRAVLAFFEFHWRDCDKPLPGAQ